MSEETYKELDIYSYITTEESGFKTQRVPITGNKDWSMKEHIERCTNVANGWFHTGKNDGNRPYNDIVTPIVNVSFRSEGFDVKDIVPYVNNADYYYKSFLVRKYHPQWARKNQLDTFIDEVVESSIIYDLVLVKDIKSARPVRIPLQQIAFCDQTDIMSGPICIKHQYSISDLLAFKGKWIDDKIDEAIVMAKASKTVPNANDQEVKTPGKYIEVYELHGKLPKMWLEEGADMYDYEDQMHIVTYYTNSKNEKCGITLYKGKQKPLDEVFKALKIDTVKSHGRACGRSIVETLFEPQVWNNYAGIKLKKMLDSAVNIFQTDSEEYGNQKLTNLPEGTIIKHEQGRPITKIDGNLQNVTAVTNYQTVQENNARILGSASDAQLGTNPTSGTPFSLQALVVQQGQGIHEYRQGKIASFFADVLYPEFILPHLVDDMNGGKEFSEDLTIEEISDLAEKLSANEAEEKIKEQILRTGNVPTNEDRELMKNTMKEAFIAKSKGGRGFFKIIEDELKDIPMDVYINIKGKQKDMAKAADSITNVIREVMRNPQAFSQIPGIGKAFNELLENAGMSPIDFTQITTPALMTPPATQVNPAEAAMAQAGAENTDQTVAQ